MFKLYLIVDQANCRYHSIENIVEEAIKGGVDAVQLREKNATTTEILQIGAELQKILQKHNIPLIINDRIDIALALNADGVHLGQKDMPPNMAHKLLGPDKIIGLTVANQEQAIKAEQLDINYLGVGPVFATQTKANPAPTLGIEKLQQICKISKHHICAIGGINLDNADKVIDAGANAIGVVSAICGVKNPQTVSKKLRQAIDG
jgi:thiamine-phosphate pyrophosphorylase